MNNLPHQQAYRCGDGATFANPLDASPAIAKIPAADHPLPMYQTDDNGETWQQVGQWNPDWKGGWALFPEMWEKVAEIA